MTKFEIVIEVETDNKINKYDFVLLDHDVIDGFELTRNQSENLGDITTEFHLESASIKSIKRLK